MKFAKQLKQEQDRLGMTQAELATALDVSPRIVWAWLNGSPPLKVTQVGALAMLGELKE